MLIEYFKSPSRVIALESRPYRSLLVAFAEALSRSGYSHNAGGCHAHIQTTEMYTRADPSVKLEALEAVIAPVTSASLPGICKPRVTRTMRRK